MGRIVDTADVEDRIAAGLTLNEAQGIKATVEANAAKRASDAEVLGVRLGEERAYREAFARAEGFLATFHEDLAKREPMLVEVVLGAVKTIIGDLPPEKRVRALVQRALADMVEVHEVKVRVPPEDATSVRNALAAMERDSTAVRFTVENDSLLKKGELQLVTPLGNMHVGEDRQIGRLDAALRRSTQSQ